MPGTNLTAIGENERELNFENVEDPAILIPLLKDRLPVSCMMYNQVILFLNYDWKDDLKFYTIGKKIDFDTWIVSNCIREDYGCNFGISAPTAIIDGIGEIPEKIKECFVSGDLINWNDMGDNVLFFVPKLLANMIYDVSANIKGNITEVHPMYLYYMDIEDALKLEISPPGEQVELRRLDDSKNEGNFIIQTWKYTLPGTEKVVPKSIKRNASVGVFVNNGKCVCGAYVPAVGYISALYTLPEYRKNGYAKLAMNFIFKECAKDQCIPCLTVELQNNGGMKFFESLGLKQGPAIYGVLIKKLILD